MTVVFHRLSTLIVCFFGFYVRAATERYIIYPQEDLSLQERQKFTEKLTELAGALGNVYTSLRRRPYFQEIRFWCADLTETAYKELSEDRQVLGIEVNSVAIDLFTENESLDKNSTYLFRPTSMTPSNVSAIEGNRVYSTQYPPVPAELRALSQPPGGSIQSFPNYVYPNAKRRKRTYIYHVEVGINKEHEDFLGRDVEWLYTELSIEAGANTPTEAPAGGGHSTCTASKAVGNLCGASKKATLVVVKMPNMTRASVYEVLDTVIDDIDNKARKETSVVSVSWGTKKTVHSPVTDFLAKRLGKQIGQLMRMRVPFVCAAGNAAQLPSVHGVPRLYVDTYPAWFYHWALGQFDFFAVGNSDINGARWPTSQLSLQVFDPQVYAPGVDIKCASSTSSTEYYTKTGTSFSAPLVAGVIADLLSTRTDPYWRGFWWKRPGGESVVWNLVDKADNPPVPGSLNTTLVNYTSPVFATTGFSNERLDVSSE